MTRARWIVCEKSGFWAAALRWQQAGKRKLPLSEVRSLIGAREALREAPASLLCVEVTAANVEGCLRLLIEMRQAFPAAGMVLLLTPEVQPFSAQLVEAGPALTVCSPRSLNPVFRLAQSHLATHASPPPPFRDSVWARLPWPG